jgi:hypothetical protein
MPQKKRHSIIDELLNAEKHYPVKAKPRNSVPLTYPLPASNTVMGPRGWYHVAWTKDSKAEAEANRYKLVEHSNDA